MLEDTRFGMQQSGLQEVYQQIHTSLITQAMEAISDRGPVATALRAGWHGPDCELFLNNFETLGNKISEQLQEYDKDIAAEFNLLAVQWDNFQTANVK